MKVPQHALTVVIGTDGQPRLEALSEGYEQPLTLSADTVSAAERETQLGNRRRSLGAALVERLEEAHRHHREL
jgi:hypothetical protein